MEAIIKTLTEDWNPKDVDGNTPLHLAAREGHLEVVEAIAKDLTWPNKNPKNDKDETPLYMAALHGHVSVFEYLWKFLGYCSKYSITDLKTAMSLTVKNVIACVNLSQTDLISF